MIRRRQVYPDATGVVTREALLEAMIDAATFLDFAGGVLSVVTQRQSTGLPGEMVTVHAIVEWRHDARVEPKPQQFEQAPSIDLGQDKRDREANLKQQIVGVGMLADFEIKPDAGSMTQFDPEAEALANIAEATGASDEDARTALAAQARAADVDPADGFDYSQLDEEDVEEPVPAS